MKSVSVLLCMICFGLCILTGCSGSEKSALPEHPLQPSDEISLQHFLEGLLLDQKGDIAKAIVEYTDALQLRKDPAIYHALARDYSALGKHDHAMQNGREAVRLSPKNRQYHESLAEIYHNASEL